MQGSSSCGAGAVQAVGCGVRGAAGDVAQAQLRGSRRPLRIPAASQRCHPVQYFLEQPVATDLDSALSCRADSTPELLQRSE